MTHPFVRFSLSLALAAAALLASGVSQAQHVEVTPLVGFVLGQAVEPIPPTAADEIVDNWMLPVFGLGARIRLSEGAPLALGISAAFGQGEIQRADFPGGAAINFKDASVLVAELGAYYDILRSPVRVTAGLTGGLIGLIIDDSIQSALLPLYIAGGTEWGLAAGPALELGYTVTDGLTVVGGAVYRFSTPRYTDERPDFDEPRTAEVSIRQFQPYIVFLVAI